MTSACCSILRLTHSSGLVFAICAQCSRGKDMLAKHAIAGVVYQGAVGWAASRAARCLAAIAAPRSRTANGFRSLVQITAQAGAARIEPSVHPQCNGLQNSFAERARWGAFGLPPEREPLKTANCARVPAV